MLTSADLRADLNREIARLHDSANHWFTTKPKNLGFPTGIPRLDNFTGGLVGDELIILAGDPGDGKTSLMMQAVENAAAQFKAEGEGRTCLVVSAEMPKRLLLMRSACRMAEVDSQALRRGTVSPTELAAVHHALDIVETLPILYIDHGGVESSDIVAAVGILSDEGIDLGVIAVDYIQQLYDDGPDTQRINGIVRNLARVKMDTHASVLALSQYSLMKSREHRTPQISDLLGSGNIGRAADQVWLLHTPETPEVYTGPGPKAFGKDVYIRKSRNGRTGKVSLWYVPTLTKFFSSPETEVKPRPVLVPVPGTLTTLGAP